MRRTALATILAVLGGVFCGGITARLVPLELADGRIELRTEDYRLARKDAQPFEITDSRWLPVPWLFADFDLHMDVELGPGMDLDLLVRLVEPRIVGETLLPFHGRFSVLRLSTRGSAEPWLSRDRALLADRTGGVELAAGYTATVWIEARGRTLRANVAGKPLPPFTVDDVFGSFALCAHGGKAVLRNLTIVPKGLHNAWAMHRVTWWLIGGFCGLLVAAVAVARRVSAARFGVALAGWAGLVWGVARLCLPLDPWLVPAPGRLLLLLVTTAVLAMGILALRSRRDVLALAMAAGAFALPWIAWRSDGQHRTDHSVADELFGPRAGSGLSEALAQRVRGPFEVHDAGPAERRVFLLGGQLLYDRGAPDQHLEPLLAGDLRVALQKKVDVPCLPTVDGHTAQQWRLFRQFYTGYRPDVIVFGVPRDEAAVDPASGRPRSWPSTVLAVLREARDHCAASGCKLVLFLDACGPELANAARGFAEERGIPAVVVEPGDDPPALSKKLTAAIAPLLR